MGTAADELPDETLLAGLGAGDAGLALAFVRRFQRVVFGVAMSSAALLTASHQTAGHIYYYDAGSRWLYMSVDISPGNAAAGNGTVLCQVEGPDGHITTLGSFRLTGGYGYRGSPDPVTNGPLTGARLVTTTGTVLATATFPT